MDKELENIPTPPEDDKGHEQITEPKKKTFFGRLLRFSLKSILIVLTLFILLAFIVQMPSVQTWGIKKATDYLTKELNTTVKIDRFKLDFFDAITINDIYISNQNRPEDTLLSVGALRVDISYWHLLWGIIQLDGVGIKDVNLKIKRDIGQYDNNMQFIINYFDPPKDEPKKPKKPTDFRFGQVHLRNIFIENEDMVKGKRMTAYLKAGDVHTNIMNLPKQLMDITQVKLYEPYFKIDDFIANPLPEKSKKITNISIENTPQVLETGPQYKSEKKPFQLLVGAITVEGGKFNLDNWRKSPKPTMPDSLLDFKHLSVKDININIHNFMFYKDEFMGVVDGISLKDKSGFILNKLVVGDAKVSPTEAALYGLQIETPYSFLGDTLRFIYPEGYQSFNNFEDKVTMDARIHSGKVLINDIMTFAVGLERNPFFVKNRMESARLEVRGFGKVNTLKLPSFDIDLGRGFHAKGKMDSKDLTNSSETFMNLDLTEMNTTMPALRQLVPNFKPSPDFDRLGNLAFNGKFLGFFNDFVANGMLKTDIGTAVMDVILKPGAVDTARGDYKGNIALENFDLGKFTLNNELGKVSLKTSILRGRGFSKEKVSVNLLALIDNFQFKNYEYKNVNITGDLNSKQFIGKLESKDANANFLFDGTIDYAGVTPIFNFKSNIQKIDLKKLNLIPQDFTVSGNLDLDLTGNKPSEITGNINAQKLVIIKNGKEEYKIDSLSVASKRDIDGTKHFDLNSEILAAKIDGIFNIEQIPDAILSHFERNHPRLALDMGLRAKRPLSMLHVFNYKIDIKNSKSFTKLFDNKLDTLKNIEIAGSFDDYKNALEWSIETKELQQYGDIKIADFGSMGRAKGPDIDWDLRTDNVMIGDNQDFKDITFQNHVTGDTVEFGLTSHRFSKALKMDTVELNTLLMRQDTSYKLSFGTNQLSRIKIFGDYWDVDKDNFIMMGNKTVFVKGFDLRHEDRQITLESCESKGLNAILNNFDISFVNPYIKDTRFKLGGKYSISVEFEDAFKLQNFRITASLDTFKVKDVNRGALRVSAMGSDFKSPIYANVLLINGDERLTVDGHYYIQAKDTFPANSINALIGLRNYPLKTLQLLIENGASRFEGMVEGGVKVSGPVKKLNYNGNLRLRDGGVTIDYLNTRVKFKDEIVKVTNNMFDATGASVYDSLGHRARIYGGLTHNRFNDFGLNARIIADTFLMLNTKREDNPLYYGYAIGSGDISFTGNFNRTDIKIRAKTGKGTNITFPFATDQTATETGFIVFKSNKNAPQKDSQKVKELRGINLDMALTVTEQAEVTLIFDEVAGDNIKSRGNGDIYLNFSRTGELTMNGEYRVVQGDYLFTLVRLINKNFALQPGGTIRWNGSPFDAVINLDARYKNLSTAPYNFIAEYLQGDDNNRIEAQKPTPIELVLKLRGAMIKPDIDFDMTFPRLTSNLKSYVESKIRVLKQDPNEYNRQVFGLVVVGSFLPSDVAFLNNSQIRAGTVNTLTETAGSIVSNMFNKLLGEYVTGLDVEVGYNIYEFDRIDFSKPNSIGSGQQFRFRGSYNVNDRITLSGGVGVEQGSFIKNTTNNNVFVGGDFIVDYIITADRRLKLRGSYTRDQIFEGLRDKTAAGIRFRQEFDSFDELVKGLSSKKKQADNSTLQF